MSDEAKPDTLDTVLRYIMYGTFVVFALKIMLAASMFAAERQTKPAFQALQARVDRLEQQAHLSTPDPEPKEELKP